MLEIPHWHEITEASTRWSLMLSNSRLIRENASRSCWIARPGFFYKKVLWPHHHALSHYVLHDVRTTKISKVLFERRWTLLFAWQDGLLPIRATQRIQWHSKRHPQMPLHSQRQNKRCSCEKNFMATSVHLCCLASIKCTEAACKHAPTPQ